MSLLELDAVSKTYRRGQEVVQALDSVSLSAGFGEFICLLGVSGCGKSTLLQILAGLEPADSGAVQIEGQPIAGGHPNASVVFQEHGLFPWMTVERNVEFNMKARGVGAAERRSVARDFINRVGLAGFERRYPHELSGGMRQRVGIARALTTRPRLLLMDEPFGALDAQTRSIMQNQLLDLWQDYRATVVFVTHSVDEAVFLADRIVIMSPRPGRVRSIVPVAQPRPRDRADPAFGQCVGEVLGLIHDDLRHLMGA